MNQQQGQPAAPQPGFEPHRLNPGPSFSVVAAIAAVCTVLSMPGMLCCGAFGCGPAMLGSVLGLVGVIQFHTGKADGLSGVLSWVSFVLSTGMIVALLALVGISGAMSSLENVSEDGFEVPTSLDETSLPAPPPEQKP